MRYFYIALLLFIAFFWVNAQSTKILFIGNSYTSANNLPELVKQIYLSSGEDFYYASSSPGGCTFQQHCTVSLPYIQQGDWDYVVLQEQSQLPSFPENQFLQESYPYARELCSLVRQYNPNAKIVFYMTWGRKNGDSQNGQFYPPLNTYEGMDSLLYCRYMMMAEENEACVSPVGAIWHQLRDHNPDLELYQSDGSHPSYLGSYIAACSFYTTFTGQIPLDISWNGTLDASTALIAKNAVKTVVYDSLEKWCFENDTIEEDSVSSVVDFNDNFSLYPNPVRSQVRVHVPNAETGGSMVVIGENGVICKRMNLESDMTFDCSGFPNGIYVMRLTIGMHSYSKVFIIEH